MDRNQTTEALSFVTHELTTPLASARFHLAAVRREFAGAPESAHRLEVVEQQLERLGRLVGDLLDATRIETGKLHCELERVALGELLPGVAAVMAPLVGRRRLELVLPPKCQLFAYLDAARIEQVLANLVTNAARHSPPDSTITLSLGLGHHRRRATAVISVRDRGDGIAVRDLRRIFDPWFTRTVGGMGLGLAVARRIVEAHGGWIRARSGHGRGTKVSFWLPLALDRKTL